jgi:hypothetical protein
MADITTNLQWRGNGLFAGKIPIGVVHHYPDAPITGERFVALLFFEPFTPLQHATRDGAVKALERAAREALR